MIREYSVSFILVLAFFSRASGADTNQTQEIQGLFISNSEQDGVYLEHASEWIKEFFKLDKDKKVRKKILCIPYATVPKNGKAPDLGSWTEEWNVPHIKKFFDSIGADIILPFDQNNPKKAPSEFLKEVDGVFVKGGNTWFLKSCLEKFGVFEPLRKAVLNGLPYAGSSAGTLIATKEIRTTNDMMSPRINDLPNTKGLEFIPTIMNAHYYPGPVHFAESGKKDFIRHNGETRDERLVEFFKMNPEYKFAVLLREGTALKKADNKWFILGSNSIEVLNASGGKDLIKAEDLNLMMNGK